MSGKRSARMQVHETPFKQGGSFDISSDHAVWNLEKAQGTLDGHVVVRQGDRQLTADDADYSASGSIAAHGAVEYRDPLLQVQGNDGRYSPDGGASFHDALFELAQRDARGTAQFVELTPAGVLNLQAVDFTTCPMSEHGWLIRAGSITLDSDQHVGVARDAVVDFKGVPILYLPWLSFPLDDERKSGFLFPSFGTNSRSGEELEVPWYWDIAPNADLTFEPIVYTRRGIDAGGTARYITEDQSGQISWHFLPDDGQAAGEGLTDSQRSYVHLLQTTQLPDDFRLHLDAANVSDSQYFDDFGQGPEGTSVAFVERTAMVSYRDQNWNIFARAQQYQTLDSIALLADPENHPYARVPQIVADGNFQLGPGGLVRYGFDSEVVDFDRAVGVTGWRLDVRPHAGLDFEGPGWFARPGIAYEYTRYSLEDTAVGQPDSPQRSLPTASFDTGLIFERDAGATRTLTLEPRALYVYTPYRDQDQLPIFDTGLPDLNLVELFRTNRYVGIDRIGDADQVSTGITSRLLDSASGQQFLSATLGQTYYFQLPRVQIPQEPVTGLRSDLVAEVELQAYKDWSLNFGLQWNQTTQSSDRTIVELQYRPAPDAVVNLAYRFQVNSPAEEVAEQLAAQQAGQQAIAQGLAQGLSLLQAQVRAIALEQSYLTPDSLDQVEVSGAWPVAGHWNVYGRAVYALDQHQALERFVGFEYRACCWGVRLGARRSLSNSTGRQDTGIFLQLELNGLASVGSAADTFLGSAIRGYSPNSTTP
ncbi:MAG TPA: LPS assembly protein LptD [Steroidobacteraceae bacterium]|nr:LPS assembly protein LptD [Steroidobacteraceae bacterium]